MQLGTLHPLLGCPNEAWSSGRIDPNERSALDAPKTFIQGTAAAHLGKEPARCRRARSERPGQGILFISFLICSVNRDMLLSNQTRKGGS